MEDIYSCIFELKEWMLFVASILFLISVVYIIMFDKRVFRKKRERGNTFSLKESTKLTVVEFFKTGAISFILTGIVYLGFNSQVNFSLFYLLKEWVLPVWFIFVIVLWVYYIIRFSFDVE